MIMKTNLVLEQMTLEEKIGQMFVTGFPGAEMSEEFQNLVKEEKIGNVILFQYNELEKGQIERLCTDISELIKEQTGILPFITSDEEGGIVSRLPEELAKFPSAMALAHLSQSEEIRRSAWLTGKQLKNLGINFNLAPVLDVNSNPENPVIGVRSYGEDSCTVWRCAKEAVMGYQESGILCAGKHFPGHGDTSVDSHLALPVVDKTLEELEQLELEPFRHAIACGIPAIMISHVMYRGCDESNLPATMSKYIMTDLLRSHLGFQGLILTDCMEMEAVKKTYGTPRAAAEAVCAGADLVFISRTPQAVRDSVELVKRYVKEGKISEDAITESVRRILEMKNRFIGDHSLAGEEEVTEWRKEADRMFRKTVLAGKKRYQSSLWEEQERFSLGENPLFISPVRQQVSFVSNAESQLSMAETFQRHFGGSNMEISLRPEEEMCCKVMERAKNASAVVIGTLNATVYGEQWNLIEEILKSGVPAACITLRNPYELEKLPDKVYKLPLYEYSYRALSVALEFFER